MAKKLQIIGTRGKSAYQYALDGGYTGSEAEFKEKMARELEVSYDYEDLNSKILATAIKQESSGTVISVSDAAAVPLLGLDYEGENVTFTVSGENVLPPIGEGWVFGTCSRNCIENFETPDSDFVYAPNQYSMVPAYILKVSGMKSVFVKKPQAVDSVIIDGYANYEDVTNSGKRTIMNSRIDSTKPIPLDENTNYLVIMYSNYSITTESVVSAEDVFATFDVDDATYEPYTAKTITVTSPDKLNLNDFVMNKPNTVITNDQNLPMEVTYVADPQIYIDNLANSLTNAVVSLGGEV